MVPLPCEVKMASKYTKGKYLSKGLENNWQISTSTIRDCTMKLLNI